MTGAGLVRPRRLLRAAGSLASLACARARGATLRRDLIHVAARTAAVPPPTSSPQPHRTSARSVTQHAKPWEASAPLRSGRGHITLHLPEGWHREHEWMTLFAAACGPPRAVTACPFFDVNAVCHDRPAPERLAPGTAPPSQAGASQPGSGHRGRDHRGGATAALCR